MRTLVLLVMVVLLGGSAIAQDFSFSAQLRERTELDAKAISPGGHMDVYHWLRTRFSANAAVNENVTVFVELQDARQFGTEGTTLNTGASHFDLRQGFVNVEKIGGGNFDAKLGRQVLAYANERLIGAIDWSHFGQSFDAGVLSANFKNFRVDVIGAAVHRYDNVPEYNRDHFLTGLWGVWNPTADKNSVQPFFLYDNPMSPVGLQGATVRLRRFTTGLYTNWTMNNLDIEFDGAFQFGEFPQVKTADDKAVALAAHMVGVRVGYTLPGSANFRIGVGFDRLSGNNAPDEGKQEETVESFSTLFATNHKFYGHMDYFSFENTYNNLGLHDIMLNLSAAPMPDTKLGADFHLFMTAVDPQDWVPTGATSDVEANIGMELDLWFTFQVAKAVWTTAGLSVMDFAEQAKRPLYTGLGKTQKWGWIQVMVNI